MSRPLPERSATKTARAQAALDAALDVSRRPSPADEAILWAARLEGFTPTEHHVIRTMLTKFPVQRNAHGPGWVVSASWPQVEEAADISHGTMVKVARVFKQRLGVDPGNIHGDCNTWLFPGGSLSPPRSKNDLPPRSKNDLPPRSKNDLKSKESPHTRHTSQSRESLTGQDATPPEHGSPLAPEHANFEGNRSLEEAGGSSKNFKNLGKNGRKTLDPETLRKIWAPIQQQLRKNIEPYAFRKIWEPVRLIGTDYRFLTVAVPYEIDRSHAELMARVIQQAARDAGMDRGREIRVVQTAPHQRTIWPAEQPPSRAAPG